MKRFTIFCALLLLALPAYAQVGFGIHGDITNVNVGGAQASPTTSSAVLNQFKDIYGLGLGGGIHLDFKLAIITLRVSGDYITLSPDKDKYRGLLRGFIGDAANNVTVDGGRINIYSGNVNLKLGILPLPVVTPYVTGGLGLVRLTVDPISVNYAGVPVSRIASLDSQTRTSTNLGVGVDIGPLFGEIKVAWIFTQGEATTQVPYGTVGVTF